MTDAAWTAPGSRQGRAAGSRGDRKCRPDAGFLPLPDAHSFQTQRLAENWAPGKRASDKMASWPGPEPKLAGCRFANWLRSCDYKNSWGGDRVRNVAGADWQASTLQLALFTQRAIPMNTDIFAAFAGSDPDAQEDRPKQGTRSQIGAVDDAQLRVLINPIRVDIVVTPPPLDVSVQLAIGELKAQLGKFAKRTLDWLPKWDTPTTRLSLVVKAVAWTTSPVAANELLQQNLSSVRVRPEEMSDMIFRVNWKAKTSAVEEGYYNRVTTWSAQRLAVTATTGTPGAGIPLEMKDFVLVEMDLNTSGERTTPLPPEKLTTIFKDLHQLAIEIADTGEHP
jgi:hypothetical protein